MVISSDMELDVVGLLETDLHVCSFSFSFILKVLTGLASEDGFRTSRFVSVLSLSCT